MITLHEYIFKKKDALWFLSQLYASQGWECSEVGRECVSWLWFLWKFCNCFLCHALFIWVHSPAVASLSWKQSALFWAAVFISEFQDHCVCTQVCVCITERESELRNKAAEFSILCNLFLQLVLVVPLSQSLPSFSTRDLFYFYHQSFQHFKMLLFIIFSYIFNIIYLFHLNSNTMNRFKSITIININKPKPG